VLFKESLNQIICQKLKVIHCKSVYGDSADYEFLLDYEMVGEVQNIWLEKMVDESCRAVFETEMSFLLPHAVLGSMRIQLMNPEGNDFALR